MIPTKYYKDIKLQSGTKKLQSGAAQKSQSGAGITKWGITTPNAYIPYFS